MSKKLVCLMINSIGAASIVEIISIIILIIQEAAMIVPSTSDTIDKASIASFLII